MRLARTLELVRASCKCKVGISECECESEQSKL